MHLLCRLEDWLQKHNMPIRWAHSSILRHLGTPILSLEGFSPIKRKVIKSYHVVVQACQCPGARHVPN